MNTLLLVISLAGNGLETRNLALNQAHDQCNGFNIVSGDSLETDNYEVTVECTTKGESK